MFEKLSSWVHIENEGQLLLSDLLIGPILIFYDKTYGKEQLEGVIQESFESLRGKYKQSLKNLESYFQDGLKISFEKNNNSITP